MSDTKILSRKIIFSSQYFEIEQVILEKDGKKFTKEFCKRRSVVYILALTENDEIYLVSQYREVLRQQTLELVAGTCEADSDPLENAKRELEEEAGVTAKHWELLQTINLSANVLQKIYIFIALDLQEGEPHPDDDESIQVIKIPFQDAVKKVLQGEIHVASNITALLLYDKLRREGEINS